MGEILRGAKTMSHQMRPLSFTELLRWILSEYRERGSIFGIHRSLFYRPGETLYGSDMFGSYLGTPIGAAAGPNTQLAQNIVSAWLSGARFIELKTVQIMDELEIARPCIDMEDEGYNVEWSQELKLDASVREYAKAWALIAVLRRLLGYDGAKDGAIFNMSVGYNMEGILAPRMQNFIGTMLDAGEIISGYRDELRKNFPEFADVEIDDRITNSCTLSTMHGCPPDEIGRIARYLLGDRGLHLAVKLNPTLMGPDFVKRTLGDVLGYKNINIPDKVFEGDLKYSQALDIIREMQGLSAKSGKFFGVKLSNTLAMRNGRGVMPGDEMYMSGRPLYPITMNLWNRLNKDFSGKLSVSYSAGADALNSAVILSCGARPVTMATDILKPGGYSRFLQCLENIKSAMRGAGAGSLASFAAQKDENLERAASDSLSNVRYKKSYFAGVPKVPSALGFFDCVEAPCVAQCAVRQDIPAYALAIARGDYDEALDIILSKNPLPGVTGHVCTRLCETRCARADYDEPVSIRALKRFAVMRGKPKIRKQAPAGEVGKTGKKVAIIGAGPSGLAAAQALALRGVSAVIFEARDRAGGMMAIAPAFRLPAGVMEEDARRIQALGVDIRFNAKVARPPETLLDEGFDAVYVACGFPKDSPLGIEGDGSPGVMTALDLLESVAGGGRPDLGKRVLVIGGGNTAVDAARTASRLSGVPATLVYRRTKAEMPAEEDEKELLLEEGCKLVELAIPRRVTVKDGRASGLLCERARLGETQADGRRKPEPTGELFEIEADSIIAAIGQSANVAMFGGTKLDLGRNGSIETCRNGRTSICGVYAGGDAVTGPATVIAACADGRRAADAICAELRVPLDAPQQTLIPTGDELRRVREARARKSPRETEYRLPPEERLNFSLVERTLDEGAARREAERCLKCSTVCGKCVEVCPNRANYGYDTPPLAVSLPKLVVSGGSLRSAGTENFSVAQGGQIVHLDDFCNECGNCSSFCVHEGRPYMDKPILCLDERDFASRDGVFKIDDGKIRRRAGGFEESLTVVGSGYEYENRHARIVFDRGYKVVETEIKENFEGELSLKSAIEMSHIYGGVSKSLPWLIGARE
jgi:putative selenate reductase